MIRAGTARKNSSRTFSDWNENIVFLVKLGERLVVPLLRLCLFKGFIEREFETRCIELEHSIKQERVIFRVASFAF